jgi:hypothetical protein
VLPHQHQNRQPEPGKHLQLQRASTRPRALPAGRVSRRTHCVRTVRPALHRVQAKAEPADQAGRDPREYAGSQLYRGRLPELRNPIVSNSQFIRVCAPPTARFRIFSETLTAREETSPASFGSDEVRVRVRVRSYPIIANLEELSVGNEQAFDSPEFEDVDSGDVRQMQALLFNQLGPMDGMVMTIMGHEIDSERAYREQINSFTDAFLDCLKIAVVAIAGGIKASRVSLKTLLKFALKHPVLLAIATAVVLVVILILAAWATGRPDHCRPDRLHHLRVARADQLRPAAAGPDRVQNQGRHQSEDHSAGEDPDAIQGAPGVHQRSGREPLRGRASVQPGGVIRTKSVKKRGWDFSPSAPYVSSLV